MAINKFVAVIISFGIFVVGMFVLQFFLSRRASRWPGLVLPILHGLLALAAALGGAAFRTVVSANGTPTAVYDIPGGIISFLLIFIFYNIPTAIYLVIYFACRERFRRKKQMDKMNIQDL